MHIFFSQGTVDLLLQHLISRFYALLFKLNKCETLSWQIFMAAFWYELWLITDAISEKHDLADNIPSLRKIIVSEKWVMRSVGNESSNSNNYVMTFNWRRAVESDACIAL